MSNSVITLADVVKNCQSHNIEDCNRGINSKELGMMDCTHRQNERRKIAKKSVMCPVIAESQSGLTNKILFLR